ncbi:MAG: glycosyltransferase family 2 protein [Nanoarchaeota archaeon]
MTTANARMPHVLVGCPTSDYHDYCVKEYLAAVKSLSYPHYDILIIDNSKDKTHGKVFEQAGIPVQRFEFVDSAKERIIGSRNLLRKHVLDNGYDYFFSLEADVIPPKDVIERLLEDQKEVVSGIYYKTHDLVPQGTIDIPLAYLHVGEQKWARLRNLGKSEIASGQLFQLAYCGLGCILIKRSVLEKFEFRFKIAGKGLGGFDDIWFGTDCELQGIPIFADTRIICQHLQDRPWLWNDVQK